MFDVTANFGCNVFNDTVMREKLPRGIYEEFKKCIAENKHLELSMANIIAAAMKDWAVSKGCTHYTHWFQPMTGITAEKHDSFISPVEGGKVIMEFSGKELVKGEPDASSFPNGGIRATFEARGYTAWDPSSNAFIKDGTLYIPTAFCSYGGDALDKKTPLLRSMQAVEVQAMRILRLFGKKVKRITTTVGAEQEYFLVDKSLADKRADLTICGRTLFGAKPPKGQELEDHYFGSLKPRVVAYMHEVDEELWKLGVFAKTKHNEAAPAQHEFAPIYTTTNIATDHNQLMMEFMKTVAAKHGLACLLHEKPFAGINGSGKHNNWSICTEKANLLEPGETPVENAQFLLFFTAIIKAVDEHQDLLRISSASAGNDHRLGANEAPPAILSMYVGDDLSAILDSIENETKYANRSSASMEIGANVLPAIPKDTTDRNRTSPFAFTGNKFEFRMPGSAFSIAGINTVINTIVAAALDDFATELEQSEDFKRDLNTLIKREIKAHKRIIFNGNNYSAEWVAEAEKRGLLNLRSTVEALPYLVSPTNLALFAKYGIFSEREVHSRYEILLDNYSKVINIEALTLIELVNKEILPASFAYLSKLTKLTVQKKAISTVLDTSVEEELIEKLTSLNTALYRKTQELIAADNNSKSCKDALTAARHFREEVFTLMQSMRTEIDAIESTVSKECWRLPDYAQLLNSVY